VEKYSTAGQTTDEIIIKFMHFESRVNKATDIHSEYVHILLYHGDDCYANALQCYVDTYVASLL
jgi:negative regulator of genetic competence, sporulation and motility